MDSLPNEILIHIFSFLFPSVESTGKQIIEESLNFLMINKFINYSMENYLQIIFKRKLTSRFLYLCNWNEILNEYLKTNNNKSLNYRKIYCLLDNFYYKKQKFFWDLSNYIFFPDKCRNANFLILGKENSGRHTFLQKLFKEEKNCDFIKKLLVTKNNIVITAKCEISLDSDFLLNLYDEIIILIFDLTDYSSFTYLESLASKIKGEVPIFLIGTKKDLIENQPNKRKVTKEMVFKIMYKYFSKFNIIEPWYFELNCKSDDAPIIIDDILEEMVRQDGFRRSSTNWNQLLRKVLRGEDIFALQFNECLFKEKNPINCIIN
ncbi:hypothetical protein ABK040_005781 [Willaertia magna]